MPRKSPFLSFVVPENLLARVDDFRFKHRFGSRAAAVKWLLDYALKKDPKPPAESKREM